jgi:hypothetical protein
MGWRLGAILLGLEMLLGMGAWGQSNPASRPLQVQSETYSSSHGQASLQTIATASMELLPRTATASISPAVIAASVTPDKTESSDKRYARNRRIWFSLMAAEHTAAGFDAWSTRQAVNRGANELNPFLKPFSNSVAMYPAAQVVPFGMDFLAHRMMRSNNHVLRKLWWLPQTASTLASVAAGIHNLGVNPAGR